MVLIYYIFCAVRGVCVAAAQMIGSDPLIYTSEKEKKKKNPPESEQAVLTEGNNVHFIRAVRVRRGVRLPQMCPVRLKETIRCARNFEKML